MWRSLINYANGFGHVVLRYPALLGAALRRPDPQELSSSVILAALGAAADRIAYAQDQGADAGIGSHHLAKGWGGSYPETTGYLVPTLLQAADRLERPDLEQRALRAAEWLLRVQRPDGGWQGGRIGEDRPSIVFNTGQVVRGMLAAHARSGDARFAEAAQRAGDWILSVQERDGTWRKHNFLGAARVYDTYVDAPLLALHALTGDERYRAAVVRHLDWVLSRQQVNGWFADADNTIRHNDRPITHTIAYTIDGLLECGVALGDQRVIDAGRRPADALLRIFREHGRLNGRYDREWAGSEHPLTTGCAQLAIVWYRLHRITGEPAYAQGAHRLVAWLIAVQETAKAGPVDVRGMLPGSVPFWGRYENFAFPNWATKYFMDALMLSNDTLH